MNVSSNQVAPTPTPHFPELLTPSEAALALKEYELAKRAADLLDVSYPGHLWTAEVTGGVLIVRNVALAGDWGFVIHPHKHLDLDRSIKYAGGELLERWNVSRGRGGADQARAILHERPARFGGRLPEGVR